jgi:hypothetical protein
MPELVTAPTEVKSSKPAVLPKVGACEKFDLGKKDKATVIAVSINFFIWYFLVVNEFSLNKGDELLIRQCYVTYPITCIIHTRLITKKAGLKQPRL